MPQQVILYMTFTIIAILFSKKIYFFISDNIPLKNYTFARILL